MVLGVPVLKMVLGVPSVLKMVLGVFLGGGAWSGALSWGGTVGAEDRRVVWRLLRHLRGLRAPPPETRGPRLLRPGQGLVCT